MQLKSLWHYSCTPERLLRTATKLQWGVVDSSGRLWSLHATRLGAVRARGRHLRRYATATNHYAHDPQVVAVDAEWLRGVVLDACRNALRAACEVECAGAWNGGLGSTGASNALRALRYAGRYRDWLANYGMSLAKSRL